MSQRASVLISRTCSLGGRFTSPPAIGTPVAASSRIAGAGHDDHFPDTGVERITSVSSNAITLLTGLHIALVAEVSVSCIDIGNRGPSLSRKGDFGILVSMFFGFLAYTALTQIALTILSTRLRV